MPADRPPVGQKGALRVGGNTGGPEGLGRRCLMPGHWVAPRPPTSPRCELHAAAPQESGAGWHPGDPTAAGPSFRGAGAGCACCRPTLIKDQTLQGEWCGACNQSLNWRHPIPSQPDLLQAHELLLCDRPDRARSRACFLTLVLKLCVGVLLR